MKKYFYRKYIIKQSEVKDRLIEKILQFQIK